MPLMPRRPPIARPPVVPTTNTRRRPSMARQQPGQQQQPGVSMPGLARQSSAQAPVTNNRQNAVYRSGPTSGVGTGTPAAPMANIGAAPRPVNLNNTHRPTRGDQGSFERFREDLRGGGGLPVNTVPTDPNTPYMEDPEDIVTAAVDVSPEAKELSQEELYDQALREFLGYQQRDTSGDEKQVQDMLLHTVGSGQADLNARLGASGFGTSGVAGALSGDMRAQAAREAADEIMGIRGDARQEHFDRVRAGIDAANSDRRLDITEDSYSRYLDALEAALGMETGGDGGGGGGNPLDQNGDGIPDPGNIVDPDGDGTAQLPGMNPAPDNELASTGWTEEEMSSMEQYDSPPEGYEPVTGGVTNYEDPPGSGNWYKVYSGPNGEYVLVKSSATSVSYD